MKLPILSPDRTICNIGDVELKISQSVDYKSCTERQVSVGRIEEFKYAGYKESDTTSVWMRITDMGKQATSEWVSVYVWRTQYDRGMFPVTESKPNTNASTEPETMEDLPF